MELKAELLRGIYAYGYESNVIDRPYSVSSIAQLRAPVCNSAARYYPRRQGEKAVLLVNHFIDIRY